MLMQVLVTADDEHETQAQALLAAAIQLNRPPNHCVVFDDCPLGITAAHNVSMKAVAVARPQYTPAWKLRAADVTVSSLSQLAVYNVRRLFANAGCEMGDVQKQSDDAHPPHRRRITNATL
jgi:beta-phosphoglucomutase-like phosphatase (HAD superfamily)